MFCPKCKAEYRPGFTWCSDCQTGLVDFLPVDKDDKAEETETRYNSPLPDDITFVPLYSFNNISDIMIVKSILDGQGIDYFMQGENTIYTGKLFDPVILMVRNDMVEVVKNLLSGIEFRNKPAWYK